jgi:uncharacterized membrane protein
MLDHVLGEWGSIGVRWLHVIAGIAWIGTSFYFNYLNNALRPPPEGDGRVDGEMWAVHGGGFYHVERFAVAPEGLPEKLHWFKWEAYTTWISGFAMLILVYYLGPGGIMVDPEVADISRTAAVAMGVGVLVVGWVVYDLLCRTALLDRSVAFGVVGFVLTAAVAAGLAQVLSGRAAYIHVGALLGTLMAGNVFRCIIPSQRDMVAAMEAGAEPDAELGRQAARRSLHNNYMTLPVVFVMISNHFPLAYGHPLNWAVLAGVGLGGVLIRHWFNLRGRGRRNPYVIPAAAVLLIATALVTVPERLTQEVEPREEVTDEQAFAIVQSHCVACHSATPTQPGFAAPPAGLAFDDLDTVLERIDDIGRMAVRTRAMPPGNVTELSEEDRRRLGWWIEQVWERDGG